MRRRKKKKQGANWQPLLRTKERNRSPLSESKPIDIPPPLTNHQQRFFCMPCPQNSTIGCFVITLYSAITHPHHPDIIFIPQRCRLYCLRTLSFTCSRSCYLTYMISNMIWRPVQTGAHPYMGWEITYSAHTHTCCCWSFETIRAEAAKALNVPRCNRAWWPRKPL